MNQLLAAWNALTMRRRAVVGLATAAMVAAILGMARLSGQSSLALLYSGLDPVASGEVIQALDAQGALYEVRGTAIYVDSAKRDLLRMSLAADGLPTSSAGGYELLDSLSGFGTTSQMFDAAYWRAKEGELARTILANPDIRAARVHISALSGRPFERGFQPSASVAVTTSGGAVREDEAKALRYLVAAAVAGLTPDRVAVIDSRSGRVLDPDSATGADARGKAEELRANVQRLLEARVGPGKAIVEVAVELVQDTESIVERQIDPASRVQISTETEERTNSATDTGTGGTVTVASNLPAGAGAAGGQSNRQDSETRERVNFDVSETKRELLKAPGGIQRISVAVLVDGLRTTDAAGVETWTPRSDAELAALRDLVASAVGFSEARNDSITIKSMEFQPPAEQGTLATAPAGGVPVNLTAMIEIAAFSVVALILGLFVLRPMLTARPQARAPGLPAPPPTSGAEPGPATDGSEDMPALTGTIEDDPPPDFAAPMPGGLDIGFPPMEGADADPVARLRRLIADRRDETVETLRNWMEETEDAG
ncbi:flagellar basal-body MS-ring/collar protein FliF [Frigidibacter sp. ROC022]|uniref:flagellar basal-body MS-ring/collar protein FliF n=1 Tax=Frigidibacter sp. ROC022 TaxID=2971796 RepID=UPI00215AD3E1|nr:flagellar basal-body MS-ring/collar protein FliF [Frigidibacter sp. ROC022]MCR8724353.1 flagellar basal-body MS-ring/collar protein FliF [Frigidibacter sp. ROC022]